MNKDILINKIYDYISKVTIKQNKLIDINVLYGDGSRFQNDFKTFEIVYNEIKKYLNN